MKAAPVISAVAQYHDVTQVLVHTGQHYDDNMSKIFFEELGLPQPELNLQVGTGSHAVQTAEIMVRFEPIVQSLKPDVVLVYGDVNSTVAAALVCSKLHVPVAHVEAGLRSFDRRMPEEINRLVTDQISDMLFTPSVDANANLEREGISPDKLHFVGNVMIDTLVRLLPKAEGLWPSSLDATELVDYGLVTLHRPSNVDDPRVLCNLIEALVDCNQFLPLVFPLHPRTRTRVRQFGLEDQLQKLRLIPPLGYLEFLALQQRAKVVITDSGGVQEETTYLGVPCLTVRENTERPITVTMGTNTLVGQDPQRLRDELRRIWRGDFKQGQIPELWDGQAGRRIAEILNAGSHLKT